MEHWQEVALKTHDVELILADNVALHHGAFCICEGGVLALTAKELHYKPPGATIKWSLQLQSIEEVKREPSGYLSSGKIHFSVDDKKIRKDSSTPTIWECQVCEEINETSPEAALTCKVCGSLQKGKLLEVKIDEAPKIAAENAPWTCEVCEEGNDGKRQNCASCGFSRPKVEPKIEIDRWQCPTCTFNNFFPQGTKIDACQVCGEKPRGASKSVARYKLTFRSGGSTTFYNKLVHVLEEAGKKKKDETEESLTVGISGLLRRQEALNSAAEASLSSAFSDLDALMRSAGEMVQLAAKISEKMNSNAAKDLTAGQRTTFHDLVESLGIETASNENGNVGTLEFYQSIARGVSTLVQAMIAKTGTRVYSLADVYCLYNRTRTSGSLIAPADLLKAARQLSRLALPVRLHKFTEKGMLCLVPAQDVDPHHLFILVQQILKEKGTFLTAVDLAEKLKISLFLAGQQLTMAESAGKIVRDAKRKDLPAFYPNLILFDRENSM